MHLSKTNNTSIACSLADGWCCGDDPDHALSTLRARIIHSSAPAIPNVLVYNEICFAHQARQEARGTTEAKVLWMPVHAGRWTCAATTPNRLVQVLAESGPGYSLTTKL